MKIRQSNEVYLTAVKLQHPLTIITDPITGSGFGPLSSRFFEVIRWQVTTFSNDCRLKFNFFNV